MEENSPTASAALTKAEKTQVATEKVIGTTELLEGILLHLTNDFQTLLFSQRVCKVFRNTIEHSTLLQKALFFIVDPNTCPSIPSIIRGRKIKFCHDGATFDLDHEPEVCGRGMRNAGIDLSLNYEDMSPEMRERVDEYHRKRQVELSFHTTQMSLGQQRVVELGGTWQKMPLSIRNNRMLGSRIRCYFDGPHFVSFVVEFIEGDTLGSIVDKALLWKEPKHKTLSG